MISIRMNSDKNLIISKNIDNKFPLILGNITKKTLNAIVNNAMIAINNGITTTTNILTTNIGNGSNSSISIISSSNNNSNGNITNSGNGNNVVDIHLSTLGHAPQLTASSLIKVYVLMTMAVISMIGNIATMYNICQTRLARRSNRHSWSAIYTLIFHLSIADLIVTGFCIIGDAVWYYTVQWLAGEQCCKLVKLFQMFGLYLSTYVLVLIGIDRWIAVKYPMKSLNMAKRCYRLLIGIYVLAFLLSLPQYFIFRVKKGPFIEDFYQCVTHGFYEYDWQEQLYTTFTMVFMFFLPLVILFITYLSTFRTISGSEQMFQGSKLTVYSNNPSIKTNRQRLIHKAKMKSLRISVVIIFAFLICWTPYNVMMIIFIYLNPDEEFSEDLQKSIFFFGMANSLINPLIYGAFHLCPTNRKAASTYRNSNNGSSRRSNNKNSLARGDSQRNPSLLTAITQIETTHPHHQNHQHHRSFRISRHTSNSERISSSSSYNNGCRGEEHEHINLFPVKSNASSFQMVSNEMLLKGNFNNNLGRFHELISNKEQLVASTTTTTTAPIRYMDYSPVTGFNGFEELRDLCTLSNSNGTKITTKLEENGRSIRMNGGLPAMASKTNGKKKYSVSNSHDSQENITKV